VETDDQEQPVRETAAAPVAAAAFTSSGTAFVVWLVGRLFFHGQELPPEVYGFLQIAVPSGMGFVAAELVYWQRRRHARNDT